MRNVTTWVARRAAWDKAEQVHDSAPMGWMFSESIAKSTATDKPTSAIMMFAGAGCSTLRPQAYTNAYTYSCSVVLIHLNTRSIDRPVGGHLRQWRRAELGLVKRVKERVQQRVCRRDAPRRVDAQQLVEQAQAVGG